MPEVASSKGLELLLFSSEPAQVGEAGRAGIDGIVVDLEKTGKRSRQAGADTAISAATFSDLKKVRAAFAGELICRINNSGAGIAAEARQAIKCGADEVLLPMVQTVQEVEVLLQACQGQCKAGILIETVEAMQALKRLVAFPLSRVYVGFNDLALSRGTYPNIFAPLLDGTIEHLRAACSPPFGFGGLTVPEGGTPIPCRLLMSEMVRVGCDFTFLRRSFFRDVAPEGYEEALSRIRKSYKEISRLGRAELGLCHQKFAAVVKGAFG